MVVLKCFEDVGLFGGLLEASWGLSSGPLPGFAGCLRAPLASPTLSEAVWVDSLGRLGALLGRFGRLVSPLGAVLGFSGAPLGALLGHA